jgi:hypothetical protein
MGRRIVAWAAVVLLVLGCLLPWTQVTTFRGETLPIGVFNDALSGGPYLVMLAVFAAIGLLARGYAFAMVCGVAAFLLSGLMAWQAPETALQFGYIAELTWGAYIALFSSCVLAITAPTITRPRSRSTQRWIDLNRRSLR